MINLLKLEKIIKHSNKYREEIRHVLINQNYAVATDTYILAQLKHGLTGIDKNIFLSQSESAALKKLYDIRPTDAGATITGEGMIKIDVPDKALEFPEYGALIPGTTPKARAVVNSSYLKKLLDLCEKDEQITIEIRETSDAVKITTKNEDKIMLIMQLKE